MKAIYHIFPAEKIPMPDDVDRSGLEIVSYLTHICRRWKGRKKMQIQLEFQCFIPFQLRLCKRLFWCLHSLSYAKNSSVCNVNSRLREQGHPWIAHTSQAIMKPYNQETFDNGNGRSSGQQKLHHEFSWRSRNYLYCSRLNDFFDTVGFFLNR